MGGKVERSSGTGAAAADVDAGRRKERRVSGGAVVLPNAAAVGRRSGLRFRMRFIAAAAER